MEDRKVTADDEHAKRIAALTARVEHVQVRTRALRQQMRRGREGPIVQTALVWRTRLRLR